MKQKRKKFGVRICGMIAALMILCSPHIVKADDQGDLEFNKEYEFNENKEYEYSLILKESGALNIKFIADGNGKSRINMVDAYGNSITKSWPYDGYQGSYNTIYNLKAGSYKVKFHGGAGEPLASGKMQCVFESAKETYAENLETTNDEASVASKISNPAAASILGQFAINDNKDCYTFKIKKAGNVSVGFKSGLAAVNLQLYNDKLDLEERENSIKAGSHKYTYTLPSGTYYLVIENANTKVTGNYNFTIKTSKLKTSVVNSAKSSKSKTATVSVKKVSGVTGYQIQMAANSTFTKGKKTVNVTTNKATIKKLTSKKKYYVRVRTYTVAKNKQKCYSDWSKAKKVTIK